MIVLWNWKLTLILGSVSMITGLHTENMIISYGTTKGEGR